MLVFSKEKMIDRLRDEGRFNEIDDEILEIMDNIDGMEASPNSWRRQVFDDAVLSVKGRDGKYYDVNELDCSEEYYVKDFNLRDNLIFGEDYDESLYQGGTRRFVGLEINEAEDLVDCGFIDLDEKQNFSPTVGEILDFMRKYPQWCVSAHGYVVSPLRKDCRVSFEGVEVRTNREFDIDFIIDFANLFRDADEFILTKNRAYAWYD